MDETRTPFMSAEEAEIRLRFRCLHDGIEHRHEEDSYFYRSGFLFGVGACG